MEIKILAHKHEPLLKLESKGSLKMSMYGAKKKGMNKSKSPQKIGM